MPAPKGNTFAEKYQSDEEKQAIYAEYCEHLAKGLSKASFVPCDYRTIESYIEKYPKVLPSEKKDQAHREGRLRWEQAGWGGTMGKINGFNATSWIFNMKNRYGWKNMESVDHTSGGDPITNINITVKKRDE